MGVSAGGIATGKMLGSRTRVSVVIRSEDVSPMHTVPARSLGRSDRIFIVLDATEMFGFNRLSLRSPEWRRLLGYLGQDLVVLVVPEIVVRETVRHHKRTVSRARNEGIESFSAASQIFGRIGVDLKDRISALRESVHAKADEYEPWLRRTFVESHVAVTEVPTPAHTKLLDWAFAERQPFKETGEGYRDALIWSTVLDLCEAADETSRIWFVTDNVKDFWNPNKTALGASLLADLTRIEASPTVQVFRTIKDLLDAKSGEVSELFDSKYREFLIDSVPTPLEQVRDAVVSKCKDLEGDAVSDETFAAIADAQYLSVQLHHLTLERVDPHAYSVDFQTDEELEGGTFVGTATIHATVSIAGEVDPDYNHSEGQEDEDIDDVDEDDQTVMDVEVEGEFAFSVTITPDAMAVDVEFESFHPVGA